MKCSGSSAMQNTACRGQFGGGATAVALVISARWSSASDGLDFSEVASC
jgi:hypothetical protein